MTNAEKVLRQLALEPEGLTVVELHERTSIDKNTLGTVIWQLSQDGHVERMGGVRGRYRYGITREGQRQLPPGARGPLLQLQEAAGLMPEDEPPEMDELYKVVRDAPTYRLLRTFSEWLVSRRPELLASPEGAKEELHEAVLEYMGVEVSDFRAQVQALERLLTLLE